MDAFSAPVTFYVELIVDILIAAAVITMAVAGTGALYSLLNRPRF